PAEVLDVGRERKPSLKVVRWATPDDLNLLRRPLIEIGEQQSRHRRSRAARATGARAGCNSADDPQPDPHHGDLNGGGGCAYRGFAREPALLHRPPSARRAANTGPPTN